MREHRYEFEMPHSAARIWALFQDYARWTDYAPMVKRVDVLYPGDDDHNGRLRRVIFKMPFGREGSALELVTDVTPERGYTYTMISSTPGNDQIGHVTLEPLAPNRTMFRFDERGSAKVECLALSAPPYTAAAEPSRLMLVARNPFGAGAKPKARLSVACALIRAT